jgi:hypothetical protein
MASQESQPLLFGPRPPPSPPPQDHHFSRPRRIFFHHPAYEYQRLLDLPALDGNEMIGFGIHHATALMICGIIAGNVWDGWFTLDRGVGPRVTLDIDGLLTEQEYWFHVPRPIHGEDDERRSLEPYKYPVVPSFWHWRFPHNNPPPGWSFALDGSTQDEPDVPPSSVSNLSQMVKDRDKNCRLSGWRDRLHAAHLCPGAELAWFREHDMDKYNASSTLAGPYVIDDMANQLALRADIHGAFDDRVFIFTRKYDAWVNHFLDATYQLGARYHNCITPISPFVHQAFVFARVAWAILPRLKNFLVQADRLVYVKTPSSRMIQEKEMSAQALGDLIGIASKSRNKCSQKRQRPEEDQGTDAIESATFIRKRPRLDIVGSGQVASSSSPSAMTPDLVNVASESNQSRQQTSDAERASQDGEVGEKHYMEVLRRRALLAQRKASEALMCCNYDAADRATAAGLPGPAEFGGSQLCLQCRGAEYVLEDDGELEIEHVGLEHAEIQGETRS